MRYDYGVELDGSVYRPYTKEIKLDSNGNDTTEWTKTYTDMVGRTFKTVHAKSTTPYPFSQSLYNKLGQVTKTQDPDGVTTLYQYNARGQVEYTATDVNPGNTTTDSSGNYLMFLRPGRLIFQHGELLADVIAVAPADAVGLFVSRLKCGR